MERWDIILFCHSFITATLFIILVLRNVFKFRFYLLIPLRHIFAIPFWQKMILTLLIVTLSDFHGGKILFP